jgi:hypothetical protein
MSRHEKPSAGVTLKTATIEGHHAYQRSRPHAVDAVYVFKAARPTARPCRAERC